MTKKTERIAAIIGLILMCVSLVLMIVGFFCGDLKALLLNISLFCFLGAAGILLLVRAMRERAKAEDSDKQE